MRLRSSPASGKHSGSTFTTSQEPPGRSGASHSSQASPSTISPSRLPAASQRLNATAVPGCAPVAESDVFMADGIIAADGLSPAACRSLAFSVEVHGADAGRAVPRRPARPHGQQPHVYDDHGPGALLHGGTGGVHGV